MKNSYSTADFKIDEKTLNTLNYLCEITADPPSSVMELAADSLFNDTVLHKLVQTDDVYWILRQLEAFAYAGIEGENIRADQKAHREWLIKKLAGHVIPLCKRNTTGILEWMDDSAILSGNTPEILAELWDRELSINEDASDRKVYSAYELCVGHRPLD